MELVDDDGMLAAIMAHEIAHVTQRHAVENVSPNGYCLLTLAWRMLAARAVLMAVSQCRSCCVRRHPWDLLCIDYFFPFVGCKGKRLTSSITDSAALFINWVNDVVAERAYSRKLEMEADTVGLDVCVRHG